MVEKMKILLTLPILVWIVYQDLKRREINNPSWLLLVIVGLGFFIWDIIQTPSQALANMFLISMVMGVGCGTAFYVLRWGVGGGDILTIVGLSLITYNFLPFPFLFYMLSVGAFLGVSYGLIQKYFDGESIRKEKNLEIDVPFTMHIALGFLVCVAIL
jgi:Flp pilus assembly protein protease CpaA